jgi:hypothetical protein
LSSGEGANEALGATAEVSVQGRPVDPLTTGGTMEVGRADALNLATTTTAKRSPHASEFVFVERAYMFP